MTTPSLDQLQADAGKISVKGSPMIAAYAKDTVAYLRALDERVAALEAVPVPAPVPTPEPVYLFHDEFDGPAGSPPDPAKWVNFDGITYGGVTPAKAANATLDGDGNLRLRVTREGWYGKQFAGALIGSYQYQTGWPPKPILDSFPVPFRYEVRYKPPVVNGGWFGPGWLQNVDRATGMVEIDVGESRGVAPTSIGFNVHTWPGDSPRWGAAGVTTTAGAWNTLRADVLAAGPTLNANGVLRGPAPIAVSGRFGVLLHNVIADVTSWGAGADASGAGGKQPDPADPGPWDMLIDYVRVTAL